MSPGNPRTRCRVKYSRNSNKFSPSLRRNICVGLMLRSAKSGGFIAGADVREFEKITDAQQATELARTAQRVFAHLAALPFPSVAVIHGYCLGGGLELALACTYRVAREDAATRLGLPEVRLGIHPGFAGTLRLPALIGDLPALDLMFTGRSVSARAARRLGLVDEIVPERHLLHAAQTLLHRHAPRRQAPWHRRLAGWRPLRPLVARVLRARLSQKAPPQHYPAPIGCWSCGSIGRRRNRRRSRSASCWFRPRAAT